MKTKMAFFALFLLALYVAVPAAAGNNAPENTGAPLARERGRMTNWFSVEVSIFSFDSIGMRYDRDINAIFSVGLAVFGSTYMPWSIAGAMATGRFFPGGSSSYLELGLGYGRITDRTSEPHTTVTGFKIAPALGIRLDIGRRGGGFINPFLNFPSWVVGLPRGSGGMGSFRFGFGLGGRF